MYGFEQTAYEFMQMSHCGWVQIVHSYILKGKLHYWAEYVWACMS